MAAPIVFWLAIAIPIYAFLGYPITLVVLRAILHRQFRKEPITPPVTLLVPAYNEETNIVRKLRNSLTLDYPEDSLRIVAACDGSRDSTPVLAKQVAILPETKGRIRILDYPVNRGKISLLNAAFEELKGTFRAGEIVVFSDASASLHPNALRLLVRCFADPSVGSVSGKYTVVRLDSANIGNSEDFYWRYETFIKTQEAELSSTLGGHGHLHAIRWELYPFPPPGTINDDYIIHASVIARGKRAVYEPEAVIYEEAHEMAGFPRRVRIMAGNVQQLREIRGLLRPLRPMPLFFFVCHKGLRLAVPFAMIAAFIANLFLLHGALYRLLFALQVVFYLLAILASFVRLSPKLLMLPYYFSMINAAAFFGTYYSLTGMKRMRWK